MNFVEKTTIVIFIIMFIPFSAGIYFCFQQVQLLDEKMAAAFAPIVTKQKNILKASVSESPVPKIKEVKKDIYEVNENLLKNNNLANPPKIIKAVYITSWSASSNDYFDNYLNNLLESSQINSVVVDIKDSAGNIKIYGLENLIEKLHKKNIYLIARIPVFQDTALAKARPDLAVFSKKESTENNKVLWQDRNKLSWVDPASQEVLEYNISLAKDAANLGFDEINFDYIRFPSDGNTDDMVFPFWDQKITQHSIMKNFFKNLKEALPNTTISADLFGLTTTNYDDLGIGQVIEDAFGYFDFVCPMVYPSHYAAGFIGYKNPAEYPYQVVEYSIKTAQKRREQFIDFVSNISDKSQEEIEIKTAKIRPWLQDFNIGAVYTDKMVLEQIQATEESLNGSYSGFMLWNPNNIYHKGAILKNEPIETIEFKTQ